RVSDLIRRQARATQSLPGDCYAEVGSAPRCQGAAEFADGCSYCSCKKNVLHKLTKNVAQGRSRPQKGTKSTKDKKGAPHMLQDLTTLRLRESAYQQIALLFTEHAEWLFVSDGVIQPLRREEMELSFVQQKLVFSCWTEAGTRLWRVLGW